MDLQSADLLLRAATFALAMAAAALVVVRHSRDRTALLAALALGGIGAFMAASAPQSHRVLGLGAFFLNAWCLATPALVWLLALRLFRDPPAVARWHVAVPVALVAITMLGDYGRHRLGLAGDHPEAARGLLLAGRAGAMALLAAACALALAQWRADLVEPRRRARAAFVAVVGIVFLAAAASEFVFGGRGAPIEVLLAAHSLLLALAFALVLFAGGGGMARLLEAGSPRSPAEPLRVVRTGGAEGELAHRVMEAMTVRALWKRERLGIGDLAREVGAHEYRVRRAINHHLGYRNFNDFLHDFRLQAASARLADPREAHLPVLSIALDCGYGSIGPFNRAFKARFGVTPTQYRHLAAATDITASGIGERSR